MCDITARIIDSRRTLNPVASGWCWQLNHLGNLSSDRALFCMNTLQFRTDELDSTGWTWSTHKMEHYFSIVT
jgi:hypothetical protein